MEEAVKGELSGIGDLLKRAWEIYKGRIGTLLGLFILSIVFLIIPIAVFAGIGFIISQVLPGLMYGVMAGAFFLGLTLSSLGMTWGLAAVFYAVINHDYGIKEALQSSKPKAVSFLWMYSLFSFIVAGAFMLFFIPGLLFLIWFYFAPFIVVSEDVHGMNSLLKSKEYVRGRWFGVFVRLAVVSVMSILISMIPVVGPIVNIFFIPFTLIYMYLVFEDLKEEKGDIPFQPTGKAKIGVLATGVFGFLLVPAVVIGLFGSMLLFPIMAMKTQMAGGEAWDVPVAGVRGPSVRVKINDKLSATAAAGKTGGQISWSGDTRDDIAILLDRDREWGERSQAAWRLGEKKDAEAVDALIGALREDEQWVVRKNAVKSLGSIGDKRSVEPLLEALEGDSNVFVRSEAAKSLAKLGDRRAIDPLKSALEDEGIVIKMSDGEREEIKAVAVEASKALKTFGINMEPVARETRVAAAAKRIMAETERKTAATNTKTMRGGGVYVMPMYLPGGSDSVASYIELLLDDERPWVERAEAARWLGRRKDERAVKPLIDVLASEGDLFVRREAALALGRLGDRKAEGALTEALKVDDKWLRFFSSEALQKIAGEKRVYKPWVVSLASFISRDEAERFEEDLDGAGYNAYVTETDVDGTRWHRLRVGFYSSEEEAREESKKLADRFDLHGAWIVRPDMKEVVSYYR